MENGVLDGVLSSRWSPYYSLLDHIDLKGRKIQVRSTYSDKNLQMFSQNALLYFPKVLVCFYTILANIIVSVFF